MRAPLGAAAGGSGLGPALEAGEESRKGVLGAVEDGGERADMERNELECDLLPG